MHTSIRKATSSDIPRLVSLNRAVQEMHARAFPAKFRRDAPEEEVVRVFGAMFDAASSYWLLAETDGGQPIGFLSAEFREREESWCLVAHRVCYLAGIVVVPEFRRKGIARALIVELKHEAEARDVDDIELDVWAFNDEARQVFTHLGFKRLMERMTLRAKTPNKAPEPTPGSVTPRASS